MNDITNFDQTKVSLRYMNKSYRIFYSMNKFKFSTSACNLPFGIEKFGTKYIANLEFNTTDNDNHNYLVFVRHIDKIFNDVINSKIQIPNGFANEIKNMYFSPSLKERENNKVHHRCHIKNNLYIDETIIKNKLIAEIELDHIWIHNNMYGIVWMITNIKSE